MLIYNTDGKLAGSIPWLQAKNLYARFMRATRDEKGPQTLKGQASWGSDCALTVSDCA
jgi:hypothetical protein